MSPAKRAAPLLLLLLLSFGCIPRNTETDADLPTPDPDSLTVVDEAFAHSTAEATPPTPSEGCNAPFTGAPGHSQARTLTHDALTRTARVYLPANYNHQQPMPAVFVLHGGFGSGEQIETSSAEMNPIADREGFIVIYPDGIEAPGPLGARTWNGGECCGHAAESNVDDVGFLMTLLDELSRELCLDQRRIYSTGMSNGAIMSYRLASEQAHRIAAIAPVAAPSFAPTHQPTRQVPILHIHGTDDPNAPLEGGEGCGFANVTFPPVDQSLQPWRTTNDCQGDDTELFTIGNGTCVALGQCQSPIVRCLLDGSGHSWPGGPPPRLNLRRCDGGLHSTSFPASEIIWRFFSHHAITQP